MNSGTLIPAPAPEPTSVVVAKTDLPTAPVTDKEADEAAKSLGMTFFSSAKSRHLKTIGAFQVQQGVVQLGVGRLAFADEALARMISVAVGIAEDDDAADSDRASALGAGRALVEALQKSIQMMADFQSEKLIAGPTNSKRRAFVDDMPVVPIQANNCSITIDTQPKPPQT